MIESILVLSAIVLNYFTYRSNLCHILNNDCVHRDPTLEKCLNLLCEGGWTVLFALKKAEEITPEMLTKGKGNPHRQMIKLMSKQAIRKYQEHLLRHSQKEGSN
jgi:hypothetical protein